MVGEMDPALAGLHMKDILSDESFTISKNWLTLEGQSLQGQEGPRCQTIRT